jgi:hypothetical protein
MVSMSEPYPMVAHVSGGLLPVLVIANDLDRRDGKGRPMVLCEARRAMAGITKGQQVWVTRTMLSRPTEAKKRSSASKRRDRRKIMELAAHNRLAQGGAADGSGTPVPTTDAQEVAKPIGTELAPYRRATTVHERPEYVRAERKRECMGRCGTVLVFTETLYTGSLITHCPSCKADML